MFSIISRTSSATSTSSKSCVPDQSVFLALKKNGPSQGEPGFEAYKRIVEGEYGAQMREVGCTEDQEGYGPWNGSCRCQSNSECNAVVQKFCGTNSSVCDPSPYLCPSDGTLPVGYVRAYLEYFLDALPGFRWRGIRRRNQWNRWRARVYRFSQHPQNRERCANHRTSTVSCVSGVP